VTRSAVASPDGQRTGSQRTGKENGDTGAGRTSRGSVVLSARLVCCRSLLAALGLARSFWRHYRLFTCPASTRTKQLSTSGVRARAHAPTHRPIARRAKGAQSVGAGRARARPVEALRGSCVGRVGGRAPSRAWIVSPDCQHGLQPIVEPGEPPTTIHHPREVSYAVWPLHTCIHTQIFCRVGSRAGERCFFKFERLGLKPKSSYLLC